MPPKKNQEVVIVIESPEQPILNDAVVAQALTYFHTNNNSEENSNSNLNHQQQLEQLLATSLGISDSFTVSSIDRDTVDFIVENLTFAASCHSNYLLLQQQNENNNNNNSNNSATSSSMIMTPKKAFRFLTLMFELRDFIHRGDLESAKKQLKVFCTSEIVAFSRESALQKAHEDQIRLQQNLYSTIGIVSTAEKQLLAMENTGTVGSGAGLNNTTNNNASTLPAHLASLGVPGLNITPTGSSPLQAQSQQQGIAAATTTAFPSGTNATAASLQQQQQKDSIQSLLNYAPVPSLRAMVTYLNTTVANNNNHNLFNTSFVGGLPDGQGGVLIGGQPQRSADGTNVATKSEGATNAAGAAKKGKKGQQVDPNENQAPPPLIPANQLYFSTPDLGHLVDFVANGLFQNWKLFYGAFGNSVGLFNDEDEALQTIPTSSKATTKTKTTTILAPIVPVARPPPLRFAQAVSQWEAADASRRKAVTDELLRLQDQEKHDLAVEAQERAAKAAAEARQRQEEEAAKLFFERHGTDLAVQHVQKELQSDIQQKHAALLARIARLEEVYRIQI